jgi:hypothetical protein
MEFNEDNTKVSFVLHRIPGMKASCVVKQKDGECFELYDANEIYDRLVKIYSVKATELEFCLTEKDLNFLSGIMFVVQHFKDRKLYQTMVRPKMDFKFHKDIMKYAKERDLI